MAGDSLINNDVYSVLRIDCVTMSGSSFFEAWDASSRSVAESTSAILIAWRGALHYFKYMYPL